jgi:DNA-binding NarL/FixJ family response regulator
MAARGSEVFVGRASELGQLERALDATRAGCGSSVLVTGEAGIGKSRLVSELGRRARIAGFEILLGRSIDMVGTELSYQPFVEALRPLGQPWQVDGRPPGSRLRVFENTLALLSDRGAAGPVMLVLEDLHWADVSTLDLVVFLAHNLDDRPVLMVATYRPDEPPSAQQMWRLADRIRRAGSALVLELGPLHRDELTALLAAHCDVPPPAAVADTIMARSQGNPFFAEELLAHARPAKDLPRGLRDLLLQRVVRLDHTTQDVLRLAAAAGREVGYPLLHATAGLPDSELRQALRRAVEEGVLVPEPVTSTFRFRHALLAEAVYTTILPGQREQLHARLAEELERSAATPAAELAPHWAAAGRTADALRASVQAARQAQAVFGSTEALAHLERALALWDAVPDAPTLAGLDLALLSSWAAELASRTGAAPRAVALAQQAIDLVEGGDALRAARLNDDLGVYLHASGRTDAALSAFERGVELVPAQPPSADRAQALEALAHGLRLVWRFDDSLPVCEEALALARQVGARRVELLAMLDLGDNLAYLGHAEQGLDQLRQALTLAADADEPAELLAAYVSLTDVLTMLGRPAESARVGREGLNALRRYGIDATVLVSNVIEALLAVGQWDQAEAVSLAALRSITANFPYMILIIRADLELGRGDFDAARSHLSAALATLREDRGLGIYDVYWAELALWERRWTEADQAVHDALAGASSGQAAQLRVWFCAKGLRAQAELAALARARRDTNAVRTWLTRAGTLIAAARSAAQEALAVTPNTGGWLALAEAEYERVQGAAHPETWSQAAAAWEQLQRSPLAAYCRWRQAEALVAAGASRAEAGVPLQQAHAVAARIGAHPLLRELELLARRSRLELTPPKDEAPDRRQPGFEETLGLTRREAEVLRLVADGCTDREIAATLTISVKTAGVHVSHILRKLNAPNRQQAAATAHRLTPSPPPQPRPGPSKNRGNA